LIGHRFIQNLRFDLMYQLPGEHAGLAMARYHGRNDFIQDIADIR